MAEYDIYGDIATRTDGDIYVGVVGPVRTGKSTFITKFMEEIVLPNMSTKKRVIAVDEMPQSATGKTIMTTEPKFVPGEAVQIRVGKKSARVRLIDCVGYVVEGALGTSEDGKQRLVSTPWQDSPMPFYKAAEYGTQKVVSDHSTIAVVVTCDGSFTDIPRSNYVGAEDRVISELKSINKPFIVIFNTQSPHDEKTKKTCDAISKKHGVTVLPLNVQDLTREDCEYVLIKLLEEFPLRVLDLDLPLWMQTLPKDGEILQGVLQRVREFMTKIDRMKSCSWLEKIFDDSEIFLPIEDFEADMATGRVHMTARAKEGVFYKALSEASGQNIDNEASLLDYVKTLSRVKLSYDRLKDALDSAEETGYGIVCADLDTSAVCEPEIVKKAGQYCVRLKADAKSLHVIRTDVKVEVDPVCGSKIQCEDFVEQMGREGYSTKVFGRTLRDTVTEELSRRCTTLPDNMRTKLRRVVTRAVNENKSGLICILI